MPKKFVWHDLMTTDVEGAKRFYSAVIGWNAQDSSMPGGPYTVLYAGDVSATVIMPIPEDQKDLPPCWTGHIGVDDVDAWTARVTDRGGSLLKGPLDVPGAGRISVVADPHGAVFILFDAVPGSLPPEVPMDTPGRFAWNELFAGNAKEAVEWYAAMFGWTPDEAHDMGAFTYHTMKTGGETSSVGIMTKMPEMPEPFWGFYVWVHGIDAAAGRVKANGGDVLMGPHEVPGGAWIINCRDPQGAFFNLIGTKE
jgi:uncharacterized protein